MLRILRNRKGFSAEYLIILGLIVAAIAAFGPTLKDKIVKKADSVGNAIGQ